MMVGHGAGKAGSARWAATGTLLNNVVQLERFFRAKWIPVRVKKTRKNKIIEPAFDSIRSGKVLVVGVVRFDAAVWSLHRASTGIGEIEAEDRRAA